MPDRQLGEVPEEAVEALGRAIHDHMCGCERPWSTNVLYAELAEVAAEAVTNPALGDQRLVPLAAALEVLRADTSGYAPQFKLAAWVLARTFGGEPDER